MSLIGNSTGYMSNVWLILLAILVLLVVLVIIMAKLTASRRREAELLSKINESVAGIHETVAAEKPQLAEVRDDQQTEEMQVVYIDDRIDDCCAGEQEIISSPKREYVRVASRYTDRNCGVDKNGRVYTEDELKEQIKE